MSTPDYSWRNERRGSSYKSESDEPFRRWVIIAVILGLFFHVILYLAFHKMPIWFPSTVKAVEVTEMKFTDQKALSRPLPPAPSERLSSPPEESMEITEKLDQLEDLPEDTEVDISPEIDEDLFAIEASVPAISGSDLGDVLDPVLGPDIEIDVPDIGKTADLYKDPVGGEIKVDPGKAVADVFDPDQFTQQLLKKGAEGRSKAGALEGFTTLQDMKQLSGNALENAKALLGSDLLFEYNKATLKDSARNSLMAVAFLIDNNPEMFCILEGHTDLIGNDESNMVLSLKRAEAVKYWLVSSLLLDEDRIIVRAYGKSYPIVLEGDKDVQAVNRRVEIKMRKSKKEETPSPRIVTEDKSIEAPLKNEIQKPLINSPKGNVNEQAAGQNQAEPTADTKIEQKSTPEVTAKDIPKAILVKPNLKKVNPDTEDTNIQKVVPVEVEEELEKAVPVESEEIERAVPAGEESP